MARLPDLKLFAREHGIKIGTIADLIQYRSEHESMVERVAARPLCTPWGEFQAVAYRDLASGAPHLALARGIIDPDQETLVRVHEPTTILDVLSSDATGHSWTISSAMQALAGARAGVMVLLNCHGSAEHLFDQLHAWGGSERSEERRVGEG